MADNLSQKLGKSSEKTKYSNAVNRTTSETMRLGETEKSVIHPTSLISSTPNQRKKTPSFQITSVTVGSRTSNDGGDDSADDLDESHTDDMSDVVDNSRITDIENETPSYSEDTFSKEDVFFNTSTSLGTAPVIPTSSQYGLAIVASEGGGNIINAATCANTVSGGEVHVSVTDAGNVINIVGSVKPHETEMRDVHSHHAGRNERFKVVKIESTEPFKRGRWLCMDYLDHTMLQQQSSQQAVINVVRSNDSSDTTTAGSVQYVGTDSGVVLTDGPMTLQSMDDSVITVDQSQLKSSAVTIQDQHQAMVAAQHQVTMAGLAGGQSATGPTNFPSVSPGQTLQQVQQPGTVQPSQQHVSVTSQSHQGLPQQQPSVQQALSQSLPQNMQQVVSQQQSQSISAAQVLQQQQHHAQSMSQVSVQQSVAAGAPQQPQSVAQHQSLPPQQMQQVMAAANLQQMQQQQNLMSQQPQQPFTPQQNSQLQQPLQQQNVGQQQVSSQSVTQGMVPTQQTQPQHIISQPGQSQGQYYNIPSSTQVGNIPISQGQSGIQMVSQQPHTSISAQTQTLQTSTPSQIPSGITTTQSQQPQTVTSMPLQTVAHHQIQPVASQNQSMHPIGQPSISQPLSSQTSQQHNIQQQMQQHQQYAQQPLQQLQSQPQQAVQQPQQTMPQQAMQHPQAIQQPQQVLQQPQQALQQPQPQQGMQQSHQGIPQQMMQQSQQGMPQQAMQHPQQGMPQQAVQQSQQAMPQVMQQPQQAVSQVLQQSQQTIPQQTISQVIQQSQKSMPQQVIQQQQPQQTLQQPQQAMQPQVMSQPQQGMQQQMHHSANLQNIQQQIHVGSVPGITQQPAPTSMPAMVQGQGMIPATQGQSLMTGHQIAVAGAQQVPQQAAQMVSAPSSVMSNIPGNSQTFSHMPVSQAPIQTFPSVGTSTASSRTVPSCVGTGSVSVGLDGTVDQGAGLGAVNAIGGDPSAALLESLVEVTANAEEIQVGGVTAGEDAESASGTSAVAIDNKIEQAMDLVKSHLMFAVREEVEVLKEKIAELMDRINQLELENTFLKAHASQETLALLGGSTAQQGSKNQQSQQPQNGSMP